MSGFDEDPQFEIISMPDENAEVETTPEDEQDDTDGGAPNNE